MLSVGKQIWMLSQTQEKPYEKEINKKTMKYKSIVLSSLFFLAWFPTLLLSMLTTINVTPSQV